MQANIPIPGLRIYPGAAAAAAAPQPLVMKSLSKWAQVGLDITDPGFNKLHAKESQFSDKETKYDLEPEKFESFKQKLIEKVNRIHAKEDFQVTDDLGNPAEVLKEYTRLTLDNINATRLIRWPDVAPTFVTQRDMDLFTDAQLKASVVGSYINDALTDNAKAQLRADANIFEVTSNTDMNQYFDGPSYFWKIADLVDPDNGHLIENVRRQLKTLNVRDFNHSVIKMLAEFKNLMRRVTELGGTYDIDDQYLDFWDCIKTMKEKQFALYAKMEKDRFRKLPRANRGPLDEWIRDMTSKEVAMIADNEWNVMSPEDNMVMALVTMLDGTKQKQKSSTNERQLTAEERQKKYDARIPEWKKTAPKDDEPTSMEKDGKTWHYCAKCRKGNGMWCKHLTKDHKDDWKPPKQTEKPDPKKKVAFQTGTTEDDTTDLAASTSTSDSKEPEIKINKDLLKNCKAYLAQFSDFQEGGTQG